MQSANTSVNVYFTTLRTPDLVCWFNWALYCW